MIWWLRRSGSPLAGKGSSLAAQHPQEARASRCHAAGFSLYRRAAQRQSCVWRELVPHSGAESRPEIPPARCCLRAHRTAAQSPPPSLECVVHARWKLLRGSPWKLSTVSTRTRCLRLEEQAGASRRRMYTRHYQSAVAIERRRAKLCC
jgi:hypothetical protein